MKKLKPHDYKVVINDISDQDQEGFEVYSPAFDAYCFGDTILGALESYYIYFEDELGRRQKEGITLPVPDAALQKLKQVPLKIPQDLYEQVMDIAKEKGKTFDSIFTGMLTEVSR